MSDDRSHEEPATGHQARPQRSEPEEIEFLREASETKQKDTEENYHAESSGTIREDISPITGKKKRQYRRWTAASLAKARGMRIHGSDIEEIAAAVGMSTGAVSQAVSDIPWKKDRPYERDESTYWRQEARDAKAGTKTLNRIPREPKGQVWSPTTLPIEPSRWDTTGVLPDIELVDLSQRIIRTYFDDVNRGVVFRTRPVNVVQAELVWLHAWETWSLDWFLRHRESWRAVREMGKYSVEDFYEMAGVSPVSVTRYEKNQRTPDNAILPRLHGAYVQAHERALTNRETILTLRSYLVDHPEDMDENGKTIPPGPEGIDAYLRWVSDGSDIEDFEIDHITHLADVRSMLPYPPWREETSSNLWLVGYVETPEDEGADLDAQGEVA